MLKKALALFLAVTMTIGLASCGKSRPQTAAIRTDAGLPGDEKDRTADLRRQPVLFQDACDLGLADVRATVLQFFAYTYPAIVAMVFLKTVDDLSFLLGYFIFIPQLMAVVSAPRHLNDPAYDVGVVSR